MSINNRRALGAALRAARRRAGMTQQQLADGADVARRTVISIEAGSTADTTTLLALLDALGLELQLTARAASTPDPDPFEDSEEL